MSGSGLKDCEVALFHFDKNITSEAAIAEMDKAGYRPAKIEELLALGEFHPDLQREFPIVALGSSWRNPSANLGVPCLSRGGAERDLSLRWFGRDWSGNCRFVAVCK
jgi:hypothetical protein